MINHLNWALDNSFYCFDYDYCCYKDMDDVTCIDGTMLKNGIIVDDDIITQVAACKDRLEFTAESKEMVADFAFTSIENVSEYRPDCKLKNIYYSDNK